jgi:hypothetical protein
VSELDHATARFVKTGSETTFEPAQALEHFPRRHQGAIRKQTIVLSKK